MSEQEDVFILTPDGHKKIQTELERLKHDNRAGIRERMKNMQKSGEVSEDPEYEEIKKDQSMLESRILYLENLLSKAKVLDPGQISTDRVGIGSTVTIKNLKTKEKETYSILQSHESNPLEGIISDVSPVGRVLMRSKKGEVVTAETPNGKARYLVVSIKKLASSRSAATD